MSDPIKKGKGADESFYSVPGLAGKLGRNKTAIYNALRRLDMKPTVKVDGKPRLYTEEDAEVIGGNLRRPNATHSS